MKDWQLALLLMAVIVLFICSRDPRKEAFRVADKAIAAEIEKNLDPNLPDDQFREIMMKYATQVGELKRRYDSGLMPDGSVPTK